MRIAKVTRQDSDAASLDRIAASWGRNGTVPAVQIVTPGLSVVSTENRGTHTASFGGYFARRSAVVWPSADGTEAARRGRMSSIKHAASSLVAMVAAAACGGSTSSNSPNGTVGGAPVTVAESMGLVGTLNEAGIPVAYAAAVLTNLSGTCSVFQRKGNPASATAITVTVASYPSVKPGTYPLGNSGGTDAVVTYNADNAACATTVNEKATSGTVTLTQVDSMTVAGSFDATFASGDHVHGSFDAAVCPVAIDQLSSNAPCGS
jgi:hypothetical protein